MSKKYFEDYTVGSSETFGNYLVEKDEIIEYAKKWDPFPAHIDEEQAKKSSFRGITAAASHVFAISILLLIQRGVKVQVVAMAGIEKLHFRRPVRPGDVLSITSECIGKKESRNKDDRGIVQNRITLKNQNNDEVLVYIDNVLILKKEKG